MRMRGIVSLRHAQAPFASLPETRMLKELGVETILPLVASESGGEPSIEGLIALGPRLGGRAFRASDLRFLEMLGGIIAVTCRNELLFRRSILDDLTKVASRGHFDSRLSAEIARCGRYDREGFALLMLDVDGFKEFNDSHGHQAGDVALKRVASLISSCLRSSDLVARYGGEEFAVILVEIRSHADALQIAERIRTTIGNRPVAERGGAGLFLTASLGAAHYPDDGIGPESLIAAADAALYRAKALGRNRVCAAEPTGRNAVG
jgi:diguanylate cyclase (GGDEF)-like protein